MMYARMSLAVMMLLAAALAGAMTRQPLGDGATEYTSDFRLQTADLVPNGRNPYFSIQPGTFHRYEGDDDGEFIELEITVLDQIRIIPVVINGQALNVRTRVIREREWIDGELAEVSRNFYSRDSKTGNIYYFGEDVDFYEGGVIVGHEGSWKAGENGALPGLIMPSLYLLGSRYMQEVAPGIALDRAKHVAMGLQVDTPAGTFDDCVQVRESTPLEPGSIGDKVYAPGIGLATDGAIELVEFDFPGG